jgi:hypothetical protein
MCNFEVIKNLTTKISKAVTKYTKEYNKLRVYSDWLFKYPRVWVAPQLGGWGVDMACFFSIKR